ncbi:MAG: acyltransferase [SAR324 cluster bacterium]|nr:acyltransferase [SAR324 cluster bacterium]
MISNLLPDFLCFAKIRPFFLWLAGAKIKSIRKTFIRQGFFVEYASNLILGEYSLINRNVYFCGNGIIQIGDFVRIAMNVQIINISHEGEIWERDVVQPVIIKDGCHLSAGSIILPGTVLEKNVFVGAGAVVSGNTRPGGIYIGNPARLVGFRKDLNNASTVSDAGVTNG